MPMLMEGDAEGDALDVASAPVREKRGSHAVAITPVLNLSLPCLSRRVLGEVCLSGSSSDGTRILSARRDC